MPPAKSNKITFQIIFERAIFSLNKLSNPVKQIFSTQIINKWSVWKDFFWDQNQFSKTTILFSGKLDYLVVVIGKPKAFLQSFFYNFINLWLTWGWLLEGKGFAKLNFTHMWFYTIWPIFITQHFTHFAI